MAEDLAQLLEQLDTGVVVHAADSGVLYSNKRASELLGLSPAQLQGRQATEPAWRLTDTIGRPLPPDEFPVNRVRRCGQAMREEVFGIIRSDRSEIQWVCASASPAFDAAGVLERVIVNFHDATERKQNETRLADAHQALQATLEALPDLLFELDDEGRYLAVHVPHTDLLAQPPDLLIGRTVSEVLDPDAARVVMGAIHSAVRDGYSRGEQFRLKLPTGEHWFELSTARHPSREGARPSVIMVSRDITERRRMISALEGSRQRLDNLIQTVDGIVWEADATTFDFTFISDKAEQLLGYSKQDWLRPGFWVEHLHPDDTDWAPGFCASCTGRLEAHDFDYRFMAKDGRTVWLHDIVTVVSESGRPRWLRGLMVDVTERKRQELQLSLAAKVFRHSREAIIIADRQATIVEANNACLAMLGYSREELIGRPVEIMRSTREPPEFYNDLWTTLRTQDHWQGERHALRKDGSEFTQHLAISAVHDHGREVSHYVAIMSDVTLEAEHRRQLAHAAYHDLLTGLPNRVLLADRLRQAMIQAERRDQSVAIVYLDLDGFKAINDNHGHPVGDRLLIALAERMSGSLREADTLSRIGGDEFIAVLVDLNTLEDYEPVLQRLLDAASAPIAIDNRTLQVSASLGVTIYPKDGADADQLVRHADQAMYQAKQAGRNRYHLFDVALDEWSRSRLETIARIEQALEGGEFVLHYQPKVNMQTGQVVGAEALIRWQHPEHGLLPPGAFLPVIEDHEIAIRLGEWVIATALDQLADWIQAGKQLPVSVNIGARQLQETAFPARLGHILATRQHVPAHLLQLEILETSALEDTQQVAAAMRACRDFGIGFALDDFGTGYSSLTYLRRLPADVIKIDQSFVRNMLGNADDLAIVRGIVSLAQSMQREVVAEGVETLEHGLELLAMGCRHAQGYGIARPMPASALLPWVTDWQPPAQWRVSQ